MLYYLSQAKLPSRRAHAIQQTRMCEGISRTGTETALIHPRYLTSQPQVTWDRLSQYYGLTEEFDIVTVPTLLHESGRVPKIGGASMVVSLVTALYIRHLRGRLTEDDTILSRNRTACYAFAKLLDWTGTDERPTICHEAHNAPTQFRDDFFEVVDGLVCITEALKRDVIDAYGISPDRCLVAHDGVRLDSYEGLQEATSRSPLKIPDGPVVMYTGHIYPGQSGVETLIHAAADIEAAVFIVGGYDSDIERVRTEHDIPENVTFTGFVKPVEIRRYQVSADVLVAPYPDTAREYMSPLKVFEYMAAGTPMIASNLPILHEILTDEENCLMFDPDDPMSLSEQVNRLLNDEQLAGRLAERAHDEVDQFGWRSRAQHVLTFADELRDSHHN